MTIHPHHIPIVQTLKKGRRFLVPIFALFSGVFLGPVASAQTYSRGVNMAGLEFNASVLPGAVNVNFTANGENSYTYFGNKGLTTIRVPFLWERIQPTLNGPLDATYKGYVDSNIAWAKLHGCKVILDVH